MIADARQFLAQLFECFEPLLRRVITFVGNVVCHSSKTIDMCDRDAQTAGKYDGSDRKIFVMRPRNGETFLVCILWILTGALRAQTISHGGTSMPQKMPTYHCRMRCLYLAALG